ncbi:MAG: hypothetical protein H0X25_17555 [Acidobacteriales bacterium]|nr:hypothetical protein [Terriglobales bacterium]
MSMRSLLGLIYDVSFTFRLVLRREILFVNGVGLTQVLSLGQMQQGSFFVDEANALIYIWPKDGTNISSADVEIGTRT